MKSLINSGQTLAVAREDGLTDAELQLDGIAVLTFSKAIVDRLDERCGLQDAQWLGPRHHPYAACEIVKHKPTTCEQKEHERKGAKRHASHIVKS